MGDGYVPQPESDEASGESGESQAFNMSQVPNEPKISDPQFKMGIGQRILGVANNFLQGVASHYNHTQPGSIVHTGGDGRDEGRFSRAHEAWKNLKPMPATKQVDEKPRSSGNDNMNMDEPAW